jgi:hypothetical protein
MKTIQTIALMSSLTTAIAFADTVKFDDLKTGAPPPGWTATQTGSGSAKWEVVADDSAPSKPNVLKQSGEATYPVSRQRPGRQRHHLPHRSRQTLRKETHQHQSRLQ